MLTYKYKAVSHKGAEVEGFVEAFNEYEAVNKIKETCTVVRSISEVKVGKGNFVSGKINEKALSILCSQLSIIIGAGLPILRAVEMIATQTENKKLKIIMDAVAKDVSSGLSLAKSFRDKGPGLPVTFIETVRSGEESGTLEHSFNRLHDYYNKSSKMKGKVKNAMVYPTFTMVVAIIVIVIIMVKAVPVFTSSFAEMGTALPLPTRMLIGMSDFFVEYWFALVGVVALLIAIYKFFDKKENSHLKFEKAKLKIPIFGRLASLKLASQFAATMSTLLGAGLPVVEAVSITGKVMDNDYIGGQVMETVAMLEEGKRLGDSLHNRTELPQLLVEMTAVGEETGSLETTLDTIGKFYDNEIDIASSRMVTLLEPIIICVLAFVVLFILVSVYAPMFSLYGGI
ncbi:type II secretion system F family protein [Anaerotignum sp.]|uniref:type II secretion system F family protein n=1 Tax=Anaerotignum sp. TaxID=2039241 RepID=UPI0028A97DE8|nr:type II secretion system F family protein [Anaerotignum sp.]